MFHADDYCPDIDSSPAPSFTDLVYKTMDLMIVKHCVGVQWALP